MGERASTGVPQRDNLIRLLQPITVSFQEVRIQDVVDSIRDLTGADIRGLYIDDRFSDGLDPEQLVSLSVEDATALTLIEQLLEQAEDPFDMRGNTWQFTQGGTLEIGPKERLNRLRRVEIYDINDLLMDIPEYDQAPEFDLQSVLQSGGGGRGGGGGGQSPFRDTQQDAGLDTLSRGEKAEELQMILTELIHPEEWIDNGGDAASIRYYQGYFIINAPDYIHREINGYPWWPSRSTRVGMSDQGRRYVTLTPDARFGGVDNIRRAPVRATTGGRGPGGGGGQGPGQPGGGG